MSKEIKITPMIYIASKGNMRIYIRVNGERLNITTANQHEDTAPINQQGGFVFQRSKPSVVKTIGELLIKAAEFAVDEIKEKE